MAKIANTKTASVKKSSEKTSLAKELVSLIPRLDEEGLAFLVKQAHVHLYNMQVQALNQTIIKDAQRKSANAAKTRKTIKKSNDGFSEIKMSDSGSNYYIVYSNEWITFTGQEITSMVKITKGEGTGMEIRERLFNWLARERKDLLVIASIADKSDDKLKSLILLLNKNFKLKARE